MNELYPVQFHFLFKYIFDTNNDPYNITHYDSCSRMYTLLSGAYKHVFRKDEYCILILGLDDSGKTTFLEQTKIKFSKGCLLYVVPV